MSSAPPEGLTAPGGEGARPVPGPGVGGTGAPAAAHEAREVHIVDTPAARVHHPADLVGVVLSALGIALVVVIGIYARGTTTGVTEDVQDFETVIQRLLIVPVAVIEGLITVLVPLAVLAELVLRRLLRHAVEAVVAAILTFGAALLAAWIITRFGVPVLRSSFSVWTNGVREVIIPPALSATAALLTVAGARNRRRTVGLSWNLVWLALGVALISGVLTLPAALMTVLLGRLVGLGVRYASGVQSERAYGDSLVAGIRRAGFEPVCLVRVGDLTDDDPAATTPRAEPVVAAPRADGSGATAGTTDAGAVPPSSATAPSSASPPHATDGEPADLAAVAITRHSDNRVYAMTTDDGERLDVVVLDGDRQVVGILVRFWRSLRLRGLDGRAVVSLRQAAERAALLAHAAWSAGVRTPRLLALAEAEDSMLLVQQHAYGAVPLRDLPPEALSDEVLDAVWDQLRIAHQAGLAHRALTSDAVLVDLEPPFVPPSPPAPDGTPAPVEAAGPVVLLTGWESGDVASSDLARRMDLAQMLALLALRVGAERAVGSAARVFTDEDLVAIGPLLQTIAMPRTTREEARERKGVLAEVREALLAQLPEADVEPQRLIRFGARTVLTLVLGIAAAVLVITRLNFAEISAALVDAEPWYAAVAFGMGMATFLGSAMALVAFAPVKLPLWRATLVQVAGSFVALVAPAGVGPAALNLRMLTRRGVSNTLAVASVGLVQVSQFITTLLLLLVLSLASGKPMQLPSRTVLVSVAIVAAALAAAMLVPALRRWVASKTLPLWRQTWPRLVQLLGQPKRFAVAIVGNLIMTVGYLGAFQASLAAFGEALPLIDLALIYLLGNTAGALVPTPGGLGAIESALTIGLINGGVPGAIAASVVVLFRALTYWARIPFGWLAMRTLQRTGEL
ncbi:lysylphosphatidylglycerol synthase transmembrane domain-containing protein [Actinotalea solisilvae]|uniref:lysylphosphatidylglycerol synthase transmembrane domain-containing protein n=1 Tax=Actinotalea solisilvae TaxID=2072922 RepID=UPI0018F18CC5|nr:lysylphosphatidylglycerol synthase transmembrane domain-containing protein [Actinotalea solisilvae]